MLNKFRNLMFRAISTSILTACAATIATDSVSSQVLPQVWGTVGAVDDLVSYGAGAKFVGFGVEVGTGEEGATGADLLKFVGLPVVSPYVGLGYYSGDEEIAYSGGAHLNLGRRLIVGAGYHSVRGPNGQLGVRLAF
ncbi:MAG: hypothetical protein AAGE84_02050 [Cyanobacteria bacterium P01_G01_bin.39]